MFDLAKPDKQLCSYQIASTGSSQAVILACLARSTKVVGMEWEMMALGKLSSGNAQNYFHIFESIGQVMVGWGMYRYFSTEVFSYFLSCVFSESCHREVARRIKCVGVFWDEIP